MNKFSFSSSPAWTMGEKFPGGTNITNKEKERTVMEQDKFQDQELMISIRKIETLMVGSNSFLNLELEQEIEAKIRVPMHLGLARNIVLI